MTVADRFLALGFGDEDARARAALAVSVETAFSGAVGARPQWRFWVPGRIEWFGKHTDYAGGRSLVSAVPRGFVIAAAARPDRRVRIIDARRREEIVLDSADTVTPHRGWTTYATTVVRRLAANFPDASLGADLVLASDLSPAAGLSSSSALIVGIALALVRRGGLESRSDWRHYIANPIDLAGYLAAVEAGASFGDLAGTTGVGTHGGSEDHTAILAARPGVLREYRYMPVRHLDDVAMPSDWSCVVATSGVHADKTGGARDRFNRASAAVAALREIGRQILGDPSGSLSLMLLSAPDARQRLTAALRASPVPGFSSEDLARRLEHFVREDARVPAAARAFAAGDVDALGALSRDSQADAEALLGNQVPETIDLAAAAREAGAFAASSFGAGFGGSVWALVRADDAARFGPAWLARYRARQPHATGIEWFESPASPAAAEI